MTNITEIRENNIIYVEYIQQNGPKIKRELDELYQYFKNKEPDIFYKSKIEFWNLYQGNKQQSTVYQQQSHKKR